MKSKRLLLGALAAAMSAFSASVLAQAPAPIPWDKIQVSVTDKLAPNLYILQGSPNGDPNTTDATGGRITALFGPQGVLLVDAQFTQLQEKALGAIRTFTDAPIRIVVNTHLHGDHTGGDAFFAKQGALVFSREELRDELLQPTRGANGAPAPSPDAASLPVVTYPLGTPGSPGVKVYLDGEVVDFIPAPASHTGGDTIVRFEHANAIAIGDFYRNFGYPIADVAHGGSMQGLIAAIDLVEKIAGDDTVLIPGHGTLVKKADLLPYRAMVADVLAKTKQMVTQGKSLDDVLAANLTSPYDTSIKGATEQTKTRFITGVYNEVKNAKQ